MTAPATPALMTQVEYARHRNVGKSAVSNWKTRQQIVMDGRKVDVAKSDAMLGEMIDPMRGRPGTQPEKSAAPAPPLASEQPGDDLATIRKQELTERARGQALKNAELARKLVPVAAFEAMLGSSISGFCDKLLSELRASAERIARETDPRQVRTMLDEMMHTARTDYAAGLRNTSNHEE